jgi:hypothetical protein
MTRGELREAIVKPAEAAGVAFEPGLVDTILDDVEKRPGGLPLLQFALREMWGRLRTLLMTRADYDAIGRVEGALARRAQAIFDDATQKGNDESKTTLFRRLFTRLITLGEGSEDTRRIVSREELGPDAWALAQKLADEDNRLVVTNAVTPGQETAEVVHEALIRNWPALIEWVNIDRAFQTWLRGLKVRLDEWLANPSDPGTLLRGGPLIAAERWSTQREDELNERERAFIAASIELRKAEDQREKDEKARLSEIVAAREKNARAQTRSQLAFIIAVVWLGIFGLKLLLFYVTKEDLITIGLVKTTIQSLIIPLSLLLSISSVYIYGTISSRTITLLLIVSYFTSFLLLGIAVNFDPLRWLAIDNFLVRNLVANAISSIQAPIYTLLIAYLINRHVSRNQDPLERNRVSDGMIVGAAVAIGQLAQSILCYIFMFNEQRVGAFLVQYLFAFGLLQICIGFAVGAYVPITTAAVLTKPLSGMRRAEIVKKLPETATTPSVNNVLKI